MPPPPDLLRDFAARYIWWRDEHPPSEDRIIAQVMSIGTYDDIRRLEGVCSPSELHDIMLRAQPGWISARSWEFWRGRLRARGVDSQLPDKPPRRSFYAAML
jgi:hypothetical protein